MIDRVGRHLAAVSTFGIPAKQPFPSTNVRHAIVLTWGSASNGAEMAFRYVNPLEKAEPATGLIGDIRGCYRPVSAAGWATRADQTKALS